MVVAKNPLPSLTASIEFLVKVLVKYNYDKLYGLWCFVRNRVKFRDLCHCNMKQRSGWNGQKGP